MKRKMKRLKVGGSDYLLYLCGSRRQVTVETNQ
jgi:hypothetical protein